MPVQDKIDLMAAEHLELIMASGMLDRAVPNSSHKEVRDYVFNLTKIYEVYFEPEFDSECGFCVQKMIDNFKKIRRDISRTIARNNSTRRLAALILPEYRKEILELEMIGRAQAVTSDPVMDQLINVWQKFVEHDFRADCDQCCSRVLKEFKKMYPFLVELEQESRLLNAV